jgi:hypothetical protein
MESKGWKVGMMDVSDMSINAAIGLDSINTDPFFLHLVISDPMIWLEGLFNCRSPVS